MTLIKAQITAAALIKISRCMKAFGSQLRDIVRGT